MKQRVKERSPHTVLAPGETSATSAHPLRSKCCLCGCSIPFRPLCVLRCDSSTSKGGRWSSVQPCYNRAPICCGSGVAHRCSYASATRKEQRRCTSCVFCCGHPCVDGAKDHDLVFGIRSLIILYMLPGQYRHVANYCPKLPAF